MLKEKERKTRRGVMDDMGVRGYAVVQCSAMKPLIVVWTTHGHPKPGCDACTPPGTSEEGENHKKSSSKFGLEVPMRRLSKIRHPHVIGHHTRARIPQTTKYQNMLPLASPGNSAYHLLAR